MVLKTTVSFVNCRCHAISLSVCSEAEPAAAVSNNWGECGLQGQQTAGAGSEAACPDPRLLPQRPQSQAHEV